MLEVDSPSRSDTGQDCRDHGAADAGRCLRDLCRAQNHRLYAGSYRPESRRSERLVAADRRRGKAADERNHHTDRSDRFLFLLAPVLAIGPALAAWAVVPFDAELVLADINASLLYILALTSMGVYGVIIAGWATNSKYAFLGAMRSAAQIVAYEIAMGFALVGVLMMAGSLNLGDIVRAQSGKLGHWFFLPLLPLFVIYFISGVAETNRSPFDVAEGESEIVGFHVEYSGMAFAVFFLAEYANMILVATLASLLFLGGWLSPFQGIPGLESVFAWVPGLAWLFFKVAFILLLFLWFRATFPRYRYDQIMRLGWKVFIPMTMVWIMVDGAALMDQQVD